MNTKMDFSGLTTWEIADLVSAVRRVQDAGGKVTWDMMIKWKRGRGMRSSAAMATERGQVQWLRGALRALEAAGVRL